MVFGAMTQANGFETGFSLNNVRWTGDYWISVEGYINTFDINPDGSNVFYISWLNQTQAGGAVNNICTVSLGSKYQLSFLSKCFLNKYSIMLNLFLNR